MFVLVLYLVNTTAISMAYSKPTASHIKYADQTGTSDNYQVTFILSEQVFEVSFASSHTRA